MSSDSIQNDSTRSQEVPTGSEILNRMVLNDQIQNRAIASREGMSSRKVSSTKMTRMRFAVCLLGVISLAMGQISRTVINYCITSMVDPRMLNNTNHLVSDGGGKSCPARTNFAQDKHIESALYEPEVVETMTDEDHLLALMTTQRPNQQDTIDNPLILGRIQFQGRSSLEQSTTDDLLIDNSISEDKFMWTVKQQSLIKGGFFYSYFFFMILGGRIAEVYGAKYVLFIGVAGSAIINLATPWMARYSFPLLVASRVVMGTIQSAGFPAMYALINRWLTMSEASIFAPMLKMSLRVAQVLASIAPGLIPEWPYVFYLVGLLSIIWSVLWLFIATSDPSDNKWVSEAELCHITKNKKIKKDDSSSPKSLKTPWFKIITSASVIGLVTAKLAFSMVNVLITVELPSYLRYVYHSSVKEMSFITTMMFSIQVPLTLMAGWLAKVMIQRHPFGLSNTVIRKFFQSMATIGSGIVLILMTFNDCNLLYAGIMLQILSVFAVFVAGGETMLPYDLSEEYPATIMAIANSISNLAGIIVTALTGLILGQQGGSQSRWNTVLLSVAGSSIFGGLVFCFLIKAKRIDFDSKEDSLEAEIGIPKRITESGPQVANQTELAKQGEKAHELILEAEIQNPAIYKSESRES